jgi:hypothetical protein
MAAVTTMDRLSGATIAATIWKAGTAIALAAICVAPIIPAVRVSLEGAAGQGMAWTTFAIGSVLAGAVFIELALEGKGVLRSTLFGLLAAFFVSLNILNAIGNAASHSDVSRDGASSRAEKVRRLVERRLQLSQARSEMVAIAGAATAESIEAEAKALKAKEARLWTASFSCDPSWITKEATKAFCSEVATLEAKRSAAVRRDAIDAQLASLDEKDESAPPAAVESYVANMARFLGMLGYEVDDKAKELIVASRDWLKGIGVELLAAFGPAALLSLLGRLGLQRPTGIPATPEAQRKAEKATKAKAAALAAEPDKAAPATFAGIVASSQADDDPQISAFMGRRLETVQGEFIPAKVLFETWCADCAEHGVAPGTQKAFSKRIQRRVGRDPNNGRPRYCHVRLKPATHAPLRLAISNG